MRIIVSAYACRPNVGSEPGVGWQWCLALYELGHHVTILTSPSNRVDIDDYLSTKSLPNLKFEYVSFPFWQKSRLVPGYMRYAMFHMWQFSTLFYVSSRKLHLNHDLVHHITYGGIHTLSSLCVLPIPYVVGPLGGGEMPPWRLVRRLSARSQIQEFIRYLGTVAARMNPLFILTKYNAAALLARTKETARMFGRKNAYKTFVVRDVGSSASSESNRAGGYSGIPELLFVGRLLSWKGIAFLMDAAVALDRKGFECVLRIAGSGPEEEQIRRVSQQLKYVKLVMYGHVSRSDVDDLMENADIFVFPSLHDSGGTVVLEAMEHGVPVLCLNLGGPPVTVGDAGIVVDVSQGSARELGVSIAEILILYLGDKQKLSELSLRARTRAREMTWTSTVRSAYECIEAALSAKNGLAPGRTGLV